MAHTKTNPKTVRTDQHNEAAAQPTALGPSFAELGVAAEIVSSLAARGITRAFAIQELTLPVALDGNDLIGQANTGMGKTLGFGVPLLDRIFDDAAITPPDGSPRGLVLLPTRELAQQVAADLQTAGAKLPLKIVCVYGGSSIEMQIDLLRRGADIVVGTPGRILDLLQQHVLQLTGVEILVLDEADEMLNLGFLPAVEQILSALTTPHQTMMFSATMPDDVARLARKFLNKPVQIRAEAPETPTQNEQIEQLVFSAHQLDKPAVLARVLQTPDRGATIVFCRTKRGAASVAEDLAGRGFKVAAVHGDMLQDQRSNSLAAFKAGEVDILVATDVAARGLDISAITHVVNYQVPDDPMTYVHRIGRTGRAGRTGMAITMVGYDEAGKWKIISDELNLDQAEPAAWFSTSPELYTALQLPETAGDTVGAARSVFGTRANLTPRRAAPSRRRRPAAKARRGAGAKKTGGRRRS